MDFALVPGLPCQGHNPHILDDQGIGMNMAGKSVYQLTGLVQFIRFYQGIDGDVHLDAPAVGQPHQLGQLVQGKILGLHACRHGFKTAINRIGTGGQGSQKCGPVAGRR